MMTGLFILGMLAITVPLFVTANATGKAGFIVGGIIGLIAGSSVGIAHSGDASSGTLLFGAIGAIIGRVLLNGIHGINRTGTISADAVAKEVLSNRNAQAAKKPRPIDHSPISESEQVDLSDIFVASLEMEGGESK
jgi:hypothetical protein